MSNVAFIAAQVLAGLVVFVSLHELGHVLMARAFGDRDARFTLIGRRRGQWIVATTQTRYADVDTWEGVKVALAGPLFTRLIAEVLALGLLLMAVPDVWLPFLLTVFVLSRTDFWLYTVRDFVMVYLARQPLPGRDIADAARWGSVLVGSTPGRLFALLLGVSTADLLLGWPRAVAVLSGSGGLS